MAPYLEPAVHGKIWAALPCHLTVLQSFLHVILFHTPFLLDYFHQSQPADHFTFKFLKAFKSRSYSSQGRPQTHCVVLAGHTLSAIFLPRPLECWHYRYETVCLVVVWFLVYIHTYNLHPDPTVSPPSLPSLLTHPFSLSLQTRTSLPWVWTSQPRHKLQWD